MKAALYRRYGGPEVISIEEVAKPEPKADEVLVKVHAAGVNTGDWRLRAAAFPGLAMGLAGRIMFGIFRPRSPILGSDFAGRIVRVGPEVAEFKEGDRVFGFSNGRAHAEFLTMKASAAIAPQPEGLDDRQAAALPFGALAALEFLDRFAGLKPAEHVLIVGASGGVGAYAVQIAKALGARVTGVASAARAEMLRDLGADHIVDYRATDFASLSGPFDVVFDTVGALDYREATPMLAPGGRFVPLNFGLRDFLAIPRAKRAGHRVLLRVNSDTKDGLLRLTRMIADGRLKPVIDRVFAFRDIRAAYAHVEGRHRAGAVVLDMTAAPEVPSVA